jgi:hypothetical protein
MSASVQKSSTNDPGWGSSEINESTSAARGNTPNRAILPLRPSGNLANSP